MVILFQIVTPRGVAFIILIQKATKINLFENKVVQGIICLLAD
jgi:hypothetical protein